MPVVPARFSRTELVHEPVQLTIEISGSAWLASVPPNVTVKPVLPAPLTDAVAPTGQFERPVIAAATLVLLIVVPPKPSTPVVWPFHWIW